MHLPRRAKPSEMPGHQNEFLSNKAFYTQLADEWQRDAVKDTKRTLGALTLGAIDATPAFLSPNIVDGSILVAASLGTLYFGSSALHAWRLSIEDRYRATTSHPED